MSAFDRYVLAESLLAGNRSVRWVLADLLSDLGDEEAANFVRRTRTTRDADLDVAIRQLPCPEVVDLGIAFVEHVAGESQPGLLSQLARASRLLRRSASAEQFAAAVRGLAQYRSVRRTWYDWPLIVLDDAVHSLAAAVEAAGPASAGTHEAGIAVAACARSLREVLQQQYRKKKPKELEWQIKRTRELLQALTAPGLPRIA